MIAASSRRASVRPRGVEAELAQADPALGRVIAAVIARIGVQRIMPSRTTPFEALARAIVYQSVSGQAAAAILHERHPSVIVRCAA